MMLRLPRNRSLFIYVYTCLLCGVGLRRFADEAEGLTARMSQNVAYFSVRLSSQTAFSLFGETNDSCILDMSSY